MKTIPLAKPFFDNEILEIQKVLESGWVSQGPKVKEFEKIVSDYIGVKSAVAVNNCTAALHLANLCAGISHGDEVLVADYTFPATGHSVIYCGARPVFVDINQDTYNIDPVDIERKISEKTKAIIPVHTFGQIAEMKQISKIADEHNLIVIEDAACALGSQQNEKFAGSFGDVACFSFHARKGVTTGEGGMVVTDDAALAEKIRHLSVFGMKMAWEREQSDEVKIPEFHDIGYNYKMSDIVAAVGVIQMQKIEKIIQKKRVLAQYYNEKLESVDLVQAPNELPGNHHIYQSYVTLLDKKVNRNKMISRMAQAGVQTQIGTYASHIQPVYQARDRCPVSFDVYCRSLALPIFYSMTETDVDFVVKNLQENLVMVS
ncbi:DegT/DnrJ/EryC1/StrS family aminotransferase [Methanospirillum sp. J.3.6.1-F.2.7.3]|uniref:DegT/DnrJ/EryC1/StrS family aminotransferase n=1 Tax=Methanospirillum purgamenti TaxID=2834276 RepID=A0A8E7EJH0_9EURY|nr:MULTISPECIES: DegT/DnrJ/EryC1/StrS family aminotransferase [Methanospirillum]MDX8548934.1 DegT/DnrJ/EryC1/StrS family aminotransferase [Methanospirillum hungatei]QVV88621.1 DegT/DnrJ/EryC1/StrS family aminotransferase [Methanospirillum sp. J.3.6.1-F.2.7.3]